MVLVVKGLFGGELLWIFIGIGVVVGVVIIVFDSWLKVCNVCFCVLVLVVVIGIYLLLELMVLIFLGGLIVYLVECFYKVCGDDEEGCDCVYKLGVLFVVGLIIGEVLMGIVIVVLIVLSSCVDVLVLLFYLLGV